MVYENHGQLFTHRAWKPGRRQDGPKYVAGQPRDHRGAMAPMRHHTAAASLRGPR